MELTPKEFAALPGIVQKSWRRIEAVSYHNNEFGTLLFEITKSVARPNGFLICIILHTSNGMELQLACETDVNRSLEDTMLAANARMTWLVENPELTMLQVMQQI